MFVHWLKRQVLMCPCSKLFQEHIMEKKKKEEELAVDGASLRLWNSRWSFSSSPGILWAAQLLPTGHHSVLFRVRPPWLKLCQQDFLLVKTLWTDKRRDLITRKAHSLILGLSNQARCYELHSISYWIRNSREDLRSCLSCVPFHP